MSIRLIRVSKELNVGVSSLVEFLNKKGIEIEANPNVKIENEHYEMLVVEFGKDKKIKKTVDLIREEQLKKDKKETVAIDGYDTPDEKQKEGEEKVITASANLTDDNKPQLKIVGSIDLDKLHAKPKKGERPEKKEESKKPISVEPKEQEMEQPPQVEEAIAAEAEKEPKMDAVPETVEEEKQPTPEPEVEKEPVQEVKEIEKEAVPEEIKAEKSVEVKPQEKRAIAEEETSK